MKWFSLTCFGRLNLFSFLYLLKGLQLAEISTLPLSIVNEAREISTELIRQKEVCEACDFHCKGDDSWPL